MKKYILLNETSFVSPLLKSRFTGFAWKESR